ncbi:MAG: hypothetical protein ABTQ34_06005 [Bdellovibrionales bacterium]
MSQIARKAATPMLCLTKITSDQTLAKEFTLGPNGILSKKSCGQLVEGAADRLEIANLIEFAAILKELTSEQALTFGVTKYLRARVRPKSCLSSANSNEAIVARTREHFSFMPQAGVMMFDYDQQPKVDVLDSDELRRRILRAVPELTSAPMLWRPSASSYIETEDGRTILGLGGQRLYVSVADASKIPFAGSAIVTRLWAAGFGYVKISGAGKTLLRTIVDDSVWQPERLDFAGVPKLGQGLRRSNFAEKFWNKSSEPFDLSTIQLSDETESEAEKAKNAAKSAAAPECARVRGEWIEKQAQQIMNKASISYEEARKQAEQAAEQNTLGPDFILHTQDGNKVCVRELLDNPDQWHETRFADPFEPSYTNDSRIAVAYLKCSKPCIFSHAHGGITYHLSRGKRRVQIAEGQRAHAVDEVLQRLRENVELYDYGSSVARVAGGKMEIVTPPWLEDHLSRRFEFFSTARRKNGEIYEKSINPPQKIVEAILAKDGERQFPRLTAVITAPTMWVDGAVLDREGYDAQTGQLLVRTGEDFFAEIPHTPSVDQAIAALRKLWEPISKFPFVWDVDRAVALAALLSTCVRPALPTCPGFAFDAPAAGTGKTLLAKVVGALGTGREPDILPPASDRDDSEARKRLFAALREGRSVILWDNVSGKLGFPALDAFLTAKDFADRILGVSRVEALPNRALFLTTGNNLRIVGDTCRRILVSRLDARVEQPYARKFDFCPLGYALENRQELVAAALTFIRAWFASGAPHSAQGSTASFEDWDRLVRQPIVWIAQHVRDWLPLADPLEAVNRAYQGDEEMAKLEALGAAWYDVFKEESATLTEAEQKTRYSCGDKSKLESNLRAAMLAIAGANGYDDRINSRILGHFLCANRERRTELFHFLQDGRTHGRTRWRVVADI